MLDEGFRRRVGRLASWDDTELDDTVRERILRTVAAEGPALVHRARRMRVLTLSAGPVLAAAAAVALFVNHAHENTAPTASVMNTGPGRGEEPAAVAAGASGAPGAKACASRVVAESRLKGFEPGASGARLELGATALAVAEPGAEARLSEALPCRTVIALERGAVAVHAKDLGGGELTVRARDGEVTVHGTIFSVAQNPDSLVVEVVEGRVSVHERSGEHFVMTGQRLSVSSSGVASGAVAPEREAALRALVGAPRVVGFDTLVPAEQAAKEASRPVRAVAPGARPEVPASALAAVELGESTEAAPAPVDLLAAADEARHGGDYAQARDLYQRAAAGTGATAEAAWVALARMELALGHAVAAREATKQRRSHFGQGTLAPEALWIDVRTYRQTGELGRARELAAELARTFPSSPQAQAARQWLGAP